MHIVRPVCNGWAYDPCARSAWVVLYVLEIDGGWHATELCQNHLADAVGNIEAWTSVPAMIEVREVGDLAPRWTRV